MPQSASFPIQITSRHDEVTDQFKEAVTASLHKLTKYFPNILDAKVTIDRQNSALYKVDISLQVPGSFIAARDEGYEYPRAFDSAFAKMKIQVKKLRDKIVDHKAPPASATIDTGAEAQEEES